MSDNPRANEAGNSENSNSAPGSDAALQEAKQAAEKWKNDFLYLKADFENYKRGAIKERSEFMKYGSERLLGEILGVLDNFERALESRPTPENFQNFYKGVEMTASELRSVLQKFGVIEVPALGQNFDPNFHEALGSEPTSEFQPGQISKVFKKPYKLHDRVIRPGQVIVAKSPTGDQ